MGEIDGCTMETSCNYDSLATENDGSCYYPSGCDNECCSTKVVDECGVCGGSGIPDGKCDCDGNVDSGCGCGGSGPSGCDKKCGSTKVDDECGVCGGDGSSCVSPTPSPSPSSSAVDGGWSNWGEYSECSVTCGGGTKTKTRACTNPAPANGGAKCEGKSTNSKECKTKPCPVDGGWTDWSAFSECSVKGGGGNKTKTRTCTNPAPAHGGAECEGKPLY